MRYKKNKLLGVVLIAVFGVFFVASCSQSDNKISEDTKAETASMQTNSETGTQTITGEVLDMSCYMDHGAKGQGHKKCAQGCLDKGLPAGILAKNGKVYLLVEIGRAHV